MSEEMPANEKLQNALARMVDDPSRKINNNSVAKEAGVSNSIIYKKSNTYVALKNAIKKAEEDRNKEFYVQKLEEEVRKLTRQLKNAKEKIKTQSEESTPDVDESMWINRLTEMYRISDNLMTENKSLKNRLIELDPDSVLDSEHIDLVTGEVIKIDFNK
tara:strand:- start:134 stop:613 length:480 start_codon:yes stop_codon:yes gene_type:complete